MNKTYRTVLCFGDSNTYGVKSDRSGRYGEDKRWPAVLQNLLGPEYKVVDDGMPGRTTDLDHPNPGKPGRNGWEAFPDFVRKNAPIDTLIVMLGTNDLKAGYRRSAEEVAAALKQYVEFVRKYHEEIGQPAPEIILVSPPHMDDEAPDFESSMPTPGVYDHESVEKSRRLGQAIEQVARDLDCRYFDAASVARTGVDGVHMDGKSHKALGEAIARVI